MWEIKMRGRAVKVLTTEKNNILKEINKKRIDHKNLENIQKRALGAINPQEWESFYKYLYTNVTKDFGERTLNDYEDYLDEEGLPSSEKPHDDEWFALAVSYLIPVVKKRIKEVNETSRDRLQNTIEEVAKNNGTLTDLILAINALYAHDIPIRSKAISSTEVITAGNLGSRFAVLSLEAKVKKTWIAIMDDRTRPSHAKTNGEVREMNQLYSNGLMFPGDPKAPAEEVCNCRCIESYFV